jgi:hypothetical protein
MQHDHRKKSPRSIHHRDNSPQASSEKYQKSGNSSLNNAPRTIHRKLNSKEFTKLYVEQGNSPKTVHHRNKAIHRRESKPQTSHRIATHCE